MILSIYISSHHNLPTGSFGVSSTYDDTAVGSWATSTTAFESETIVHSFSNISIEPMNNDKRMASNTAQIQHAYEAMYRLYTTDTSNGYTHINLYYSDKTLLKALEHLSAIINMFHSPIPSEVAKKIPNATPRKILHRMQSDGYIDTSGLSNINEDGFIERCLEGILAHAPTQKCRRIKFKRLAWTPQLETAQKRGKVQDWSSVEVSNAGINHQVAYRIVNKRTLEKFIQEVRKTNATITNEEIVKKYREHFRIKKMDNIQRARGEMQ